MAGIDSPAPVDADAALASLGRFRRVISVI